MGIQDYPLNVFNSHINESSIYTLPKNHLEGMPLSEFWFLCSGCDSKASCTFIIEGLERNEWTATKPTVSANTLMLSREVSKSAFTDPA